MKRKFKLFATLASLCLSVALMAFGVYAATHVTYNVTSTVSFASQVAGQFSWKVAGGSVETDANEPARASYQSDEAFEAAHDAWELAKREGVETALDGTEQHNTGSGAESLYALTKNLGNFEFHPETGDLVITYYVYFQNMSTDTDAVVSTSIAALYGLESADNAQLDIKVVQGSAATKSAAKTAADTALASASELDAIPTLDSVTLAKTTTSNGNVFYYVAIEVTLADASTKLLSTNDTLDITLSVEPDQA